MKMKEKGHWNLRGEDKVVVLVMPEPVRKVRCGMAVTFEFQHYN